MPTLRALVIGYGSIGQRHAGVLAELGHEVAVVSKRDLADEPYTFFKTIAQAVATYNPAYVVVASVTADHTRHLDELAAAGFKGKVLVEKPLYTQSQALPQYPFTVAVGYQLRYHPLVVELHKRLQNAKVLCAVMYVGQHLEQWRPGRDVKQVYSAHRSMGGGVLRDLSHEMDLAQFLFGTPQLVSAHVARVGDVTVDAEDVADMLLRCPQSPMVSVHLNYLDKQSCRNIRVVTEEGTLVADFIKGTLTDKGEVTPYTVQRNDCYAAMHNDVVKHEASAHVCSLKEGLAIVNLIADIEKATA